MKLPWDDRYSCAHPTTKPFNKAMADLSVIIVNYNVAYFLEQCLHSVFRAVDGLDVEVFVVDNDSVDGSVAMVREKFPQVDLTAMKENLGFSRANNLVIKRAT